MVRQYIGARYVPKFYEYNGSNNWRSNVSYEALTIVTYNQNTYTSKKPVPANIGNPAANPEYWVLSANFNSQVEEYRKIAQALRNNMFNRKFILVGDSYGMRNTPNWASLFEARNDVVANDCRSGAGFAPYTHSAYNFQDIIEDITAGLSQSQREDVTDIIVCGGWNDARTYQSGEKTLSQIQGYIYNFYDYCRTNYPNARVHIGFIGWQTYDASQASDASFNSLRGIEKVYTYTVYKSLHNLQNVNYVMKNAKFMDETKFHPNNTNGAEYLYYAIAKAVDDSFDFRFNYAITASDLEDISEDIDEIADIRAGIYNGVTKIVIYFKIKANTEITSNSQNLFKFKEGVLPYDYSYPVRGQGVCFSNIDSEIAPRNFFTTITTGRVFQTILPKGVHAVTSTCTCTLTILNDFAC